MNSIVRSLILIIVMCCSSAYASSASGDGREERSLRFLSGEVVTTSERNLLDAGQVPVERDALRHGVVQLDGALTRERVAKLAAVGIKLGQYVPENAFLVNLESVDLSAARDLGFVVWVGEYRNEWKVSSSVGRPSASFDTEKRRSIAERGDLKLVVFLFADADEERAIRDIHALGCEVIGSHDCGDQIVVDLVCGRTQLSGLVAHEDVQFIEEAPEISLRNSTNRWIVQSNTVDVTPLYDNGLTGADQIIGIMDGRVNKDHCAFEDTNPIGPTHRKIEAYNTSTGYDSHGTHVAGIAVGDGGAWDDNRGIAYDGRFVYNTPPSYPYGETDMVTRLNQHHSQGARIHTNSWGDDYTTEYNGLARAIDRFSHDNEDDLVLFAVTNGSYLKNPENAKNVLAVGASLDTPSQDSHCSGGTGPTADGRRKPEIYAPGCGTYSASGSGDSCNTAPMTGTSMASPAVAGTAMLVRQYYTEGYYPSGAASVSDTFVPSGALLKATLLNSAVDMTGISGYPSNLEGWGRLLADNALYFAGESRTLAVFDVRNPEGLSTGETDTHDISVTGSGEVLRITMVFTDAPAAAGAAAPVVNDLDLRVTAPDGTTSYFGNVFSGGYSATGGSPDALNNVEQVHIPVPAPGVYEIEIGATAVNDGPQGYALVVSGEVSLGPAPPETEDVDYVTSVDTTGDIELIAFDQDGDPLDFILVTLPSHGILSDPNGGMIASVPYTLLSRGCEVSYSPDTAYAGDDGFSFKANDGGTYPEGGDSNISQVDITVMADQPEITTTYLPAGKLGEEYGQFAFDHTGGQPPVAWRVVADGAYGEVSLGVNEFTLTGQARGWQGDEGFRYYFLPFAFPFYGQQYNYVRVRYNGFIDFGSFEGSQFENSVAGLMQNRMIAPLWDDLRTDSAGGDIFIDESDPHSVTIRWEGIVNGGGNPVRFAATLYEAGNIRFHYGTGNDPISPTIGISKGDGASYVISSLDGAASLNEVDSLMYGPPGLLPSGMVFSEDGQLSGVPSEEGLFEVMFRLEDNLGRFDQRLLPVFVAGPYSGDFDEDGDVDLADFAGMQMCFGVSPVVPPCTSGDLNGDGVISWIDFYWFSALLDGPH